VSYEQKNNSGSLFANDKGGNQNKPDFKGSIVVDGKSYWISAWEKVSTKGTNWISLSVELQTRPDVSGQVPATQTDRKAQNAPRAQQARPQGRDTAMQSHGSPDGSDNFDDDIPF